ncbi:hypothetical protein CDL12_20615 [Handroanthus impetiginosus]|uniref:Uncharacterized protein n=1 Tax=Handroanthus impetiginosus TaxID=429701 RepID=A0A2G9GNQ5_9LAMI|nr:hypothetical protein CDL12_20615 [Handroanthus impetiginosus]
MGKKIPLVSFLCGVLARKKTPPPDMVEDAAKAEDNSDSSTSGGGDAAAPKDAIPNQPSTQGGESSEDAADEITVDDNHRQPLPPPPGAGHHLRTASCHHQHHRSNSATSKLLSSVSMRVLGQSSRWEEKPWHREKKSKQEDSVWKKTIILGEKCKVPDEDEEDILYDEKGNKISTYHPKNHSSTLSLSRQISCVGKDELSRK